MSGNEIPNALCEPVIHKKGFQTSQTSTWHLSYIVGNYPHCRKIERLLSLWEQEKLRVSINTVTRKSLSIINIKGSLKMEVKAMWACRPKNTNLSHFSGKTSVWHINSKQSKQWSCSPKKSRILHINSTELNTTKHIINSHRTLPPYLHRNREKLTKWHLPMLIQRRKHLHRTRLLWMQPS